MFDKIFKEKNSYQEMDWKEICSQDTLKELDQSFVLQTTCQLWFYCICIKVLSGNQSSLPTQKINATYVVYCQ